MHRNSLALFNRYAIPAIEPGRLVLEVGGITPHYREALLASGEEHNSTTWITCDRTQKEAGPASIGMSGDYEIDSGDAVYHYVLAGQVIEHVRKPWLWLPELARVTRHGGLIILISPISWGHHKAPVDCWRIWPDGMRALLDEAGLEEELIRAEALDATAKEERCQINPGKVLDLITIARKPEKLATEEDAE